MEDHHPDYGTACKRHESKELPLLIRFSSTIVVTKWENEVINAAVFLDSLSIYFNAIDDDLIKNELAKILVKYLYH